MADYFNVLGLPKGASKAEIKKAYRKLVFVWHPDKNPSPEARRKFIELTEAYDALMAGKTFSVSSVFSTKNKTAAEPKQKSREDIRREKVMRSYDNYREKFRNIRNRYRNGRDAAVYRKEFYGKAYRYYGLCAAVLVLPVLLTLVSFSWGILVIYPFCIGFALRFFLTAAQHRERAEMIFGEEENYSYNELKEFFTMGRSAGSTGENLFDGF
ncbi:MAG TPA: DnaJ domain-containing protein [Bacteroidia bacterium]|nr:DnaJ domain-containing protein [Bacteroidia bacterium]